MKARKLISLITAFVLVISAAGAFTTPVAASSPINDLGTVMKTSADRLTVMQNTDGGWDWELTDNDPSTGSASNTVGPIAEGLAQAYLHTGAVEHFAALQKAGAYLLTKTTNFSPSDGYLAAQLDAIFGGTTYRDYVRTNFYTPLANGTYDKKGLGILYSTATYVTAIRNSRAGNQANMAAWDIGMGLVGAASCGASTSEWINGVEAEINELNTDTAVSYYDVIGLAGAIYGLAFVNVDFDPTSGSFASANSIADLADLLIGAQINNGGFSWASTVVKENDYNESVQETAYAILALNEVNRANYLVRLQGAADYLLSSQMTTGGWGWVDSSLNLVENNELTGEAMWGISMVYPELWVCPSGDCGHPSASYNTIQASIDAANGGETINVAAGKYVENVNINKAVTLVGAGADTTKIVATDAAALAALTFNTSGATVRSFTVTHEYTPAELADWGQTLPFNGGGVSFSGNNNTLENCVITLNRNGVYVGNTQGNVIHSNTLTNNRTGINMTGNITGTQIIHNTISQNWTLGLVFYNLAPTDLSSLIVTGNTFDSNWYSEILIKAPYNGGTGALNVTDNTFMDNPVTYSTSADASLNEPGFAAQKPEVVGGTATKPVQEFPTFRVYGSPTLDIRYDGSMAKILNVGTGEAYTTIQDAITAAQPGDIINVAPGSYDKFIVSNPGITINLNGAIINGASPCMTISADDTSILGPGTCNGGFTVTDNVKRLLIKGVDITGGTGHTGVALGSTLSDIKILDNNIHGLDTGISVTGAVGGVFSIQGNRFTSNTMDISSTLAVNAEYNDWGSQTGPATGKVSTGVDTDPYTYSKLSVLPVPSSVVTGNDFTATVKVDGRNLTALDFVLKYDPSKISVNGSPTNEGLLPVGTSIVVDAINGTIHFKGAVQGSAINTDAKTVMTISFNALGATTVLSETTNLDLDETSDAYGMVASDSTLIYGETPEDATVTIQHPTFKVTGQVDLQGRSNESGALLNLAMLNTFGPYSAASDSWGKITLTAVAGDTYTLSISRDQYLDLLPMQLTISANKDLSKLVMIAGDVSGSTTGMEDNIINMYDVSYISNVYSFTSGYGKADLNGDGVVNIYDLALVGGNYDKNSTTAYTWAP